ncbi:MAG: tyrosine--tRNA ligase [Bacillales bacterium]|nr:tyrosine--tRNA ligase [Bacillales bacterium]
MGIYEELEWRGLIKDVSDPSVREKINAGGVTFYIGTDPTGDSLHIGHFSSFLISKRLKDAGHNPILLVGGGTGLIGDPKPDAERPMITYEQVNHNFECLKEQATRLFGFEVVNNADWLKNINIIDFLRDFGKYFNVNYMLGKDIVARRLDSGITFTEFSYMTLQALDFWYLNKTKNVTFQVAGQDQWGNITAGIDLIRRKEGKEAYAFTMPLLTKSDGTKFGKTNGKAIWLDRNKTSPYEMYQFFINSEDSKVIDYLKFLTFLSKEEIEELERKNLEHPELREAHKALAREVITFIHGKEAYEEALKQAESLFGKGDNSKDMPSTPIDASLLVDDKLDVLSLLVASGLATSKSDARRSVEQGGVMINDNKITDVKFAVSKEDLLDGVFVRKGKKNFKKVTIE